MMEDFSIPETSDGGSYPWQRVGRFEIRQSWNLPSVVAFHFQLSVQNNAPFFDTPNTGAATASYHVLRARRGARAPPGRLIRVRIQVSLAVLGDFGASEAASPSPEGFRTAGHKKGTLPRSSIIHVPFRAASEFVV